ncbi:MULTISPECIES: IS1182 family transposase [Paraburkholderia]|uniref:IS1182 family transposase n=1 Tax=Paraburkholderia TaxID=1822464 RepID=UPI000379877A|nr:MULTISPECIES: IS1182 family transposase [Paraburkholderia]MDH6147263.1 transposase [Paraburkholderia sp. WSM4179]
MKRFVQGDNRTQSFLLPEALDDYVTDTNPVRVVDVFVDELDLHKLGFEGVEPALTGRPSYHPEVMLKIYIYGYLNRIQSSRRLEREAQRNVELMWLTGRLAPDFKTIARFRKDNGKAIRSVCRQFVMLCQRLDLFAEAIVAIDGSKFKAVNHRDRNFTSAKLERRMRDIESSIARYLEAMDTADRQEPAIAKVRTERLQDKIAALKEQMRGLKEIEVQLNAAPDKQVSLTDPDARSMKTRGTGVVGYNVQTAVDAKHHLIVAHVVINDGIDRDQLTSMAKLARTEMAVDKLTAVADRGYYKSEEILACHEAGISVLVPKPVTSSATANGRFGKDDFIYNAQTDEYRCPAGQRLIWRFSTVERGLKISKYWSSNCQQCSLKGDCTPGTQRRVARWEHEDVLDEMQARLDHAPEMMRIRRQTVEHPFGTIKAWMGATHFLTRTIERVSTEMSLHVLAYNMKRVIKLLGSEALMTAMRA